VNQCSSHGEQDSNKRTERVAELLGLVGLRPEYMRRYPHAFSGGQRQRIGIARALALNPRLVVADEPVSALDVSVQAQILNLMLELQEKLGLTYLFVAHDLSVVKHISERVAVMYVGRIVEMAPTAELFYAPRHPYTEALMSAVPKPDPRLRSERIILQGEVGRPGESAAGVLFQSTLPVRAGHLPRKNTWARRDHAEAFRCVSSRKRPFVARSREKIKRRD